MRAPWLFLLVFVAYLFGPLRAQTGPPPPSALGPLAAAPFAKLVHLVYPTAEPSLKALWASRLAGASWTAAAVALTFLALSCLTTPRAALLLSLLGAFASPLWSSASRAQAPQAPAALVVATLVWLAARRPTAAPREQRLGDVASGALAVALILLDPTHPVTPLALLLSVRTMPWTRPAAALTAAGAAAAALAGTWVANPAAQAWDAVRFSAFDPAVLAAYLVSPGRGLAFFVPVSVLAAAALVRGDGPRRLVLGCAASALVALAEVACLDPASNPETFGPSTLAPCVPLLAAMAAGLPLAGIRWGVLFALPALVAHAAAVFAGGHTWDERRDLVAHPDAVWDVRDTPFSDLVVGPPRPDIAGLVPTAFLMTPGEHEIRAGKPGPWLLYGWETPEPTGTWGSGTESWIAVAVPPGNYVLTIMATAPRVRGRAQRLEIERPGESPVEITFGQGLWNLQPVVIRFRPEAGVAVFKLRPAHTWQPGDGDVRRLSVFVASVWLERGAAR